MLLRATVALALATGLAQAVPARAAAADPAAARPASDEAGRAPAPGASGSSSSDEGDASNGGGEPGGRPQSGATDDGAGAGEDESAGAGEGDGEGEGEGGPDAPEPLRGLTCLEGDATGGRRKGVQRRDFLKRHRVELAAVGGFYASDALSSTYSYGGAVAFFPSEDFGLELLVTRSPVKFRLEEPFNAFDRERHFPPGAAFQAVASLLWSPIHAKLRFSDTNIVHGDIFVVAGAGRTMHESVLGLTWEAGAGLKLYLSRFVTFRFDVRDFLLPQEVLGRGRITNNVTVLAGLSVWLG